RETGDAGTVGDVLEGAVAPIAEKAIATRVTGILPVAISGLEDCATGREVTALDEVDVEPAVAVEVEQADAPAGRLGELVDGRLAVVEDERQSGRRGVVAEFGRGAPRRVGGLRHRSMGRAQFRGEQVGEGLPGSVDRGPGATGPRQGGLDLRTGGLATCG